MLTRELHILDALEPHIAALGRTGQASTLVAVVQGLTGVLEGCGRELGLKTGLAGGFAELIGAEYEAGRLTLDQATLAMAESSLSIARALADASGLVESDARLWRSAVETVQSAHAQLRQLVSDNQ